jgi:hypothetical protein
MIKMDIQVSVLYVDLYLRMVQQGEKIGLFLDFDEISY